MECVSVQLSTPASVEEVVDAMRSYESEAQRLQLPSAPPRPIVVLSADDRPQPKLDRNAGGGMVVTVGRVRACPLLSVKFVVCSHNTVIGAAGGSIQNAELAYARGLLAGGDDRGSKR
jgi:aspartate-semialdehyde dehydrogenase